MPRGQPDYGMYAAQDYLATMADMAELAVRLGSIVIFDRRGKVIDFDDFERPQLSWLGGGDAGYTIILDSSNSKSGSQCVKLTPNAVIGNYVEIWRGFSLLASKRNGIEIAFSQVSTNNYFEIELNHYDEADQYQGKIKIDFNALKLYYYDNTGYHELADTNSFSLWRRIFYPIKLVVDFETHKYIRLIFGDIEYDLSSYSLYTTADLVTPAQLTTLYRLTQRVAAVGNIYLDDHILTIDEP